MQVVVVTVPPKTKYAEKARLMDDAVAREGGRALDSKAAVALSRRG